MLITAAAGCPRVYGIPARNSYIYIIAFFISFFSLPVFIRLFRARRITKTASFVSRFIAELLEGETSPFTCCQMYCT